MPFGTTLLAAECYFCAGVCLWRGLEGLFPGSPRSLHSCHRKPARESAASASILLLEMELFTS